MTKIEEKKKSKLCWIFKIEDHLNYLQDVARSYLCPMLLYI